MNSQGERETPSELIDAIDDLVAFVEAHDDRKRRDSGLTPDLQSDLSRKDARAFSLAKRLGLPIPDVELTRSPPGTLAKPRRCGYTGVPVVGGLRGNIMIRATSNWKSRLASLRHAAELMNDRRRIRSSHRRRSRTLPRDRKLTANEAAALQFVAECNGNVSEAARRLGKDRTTVNEQYKNGLAKIGRTAKREYHKTTTLPSDRRGQGTVATHEPEPDLD